MNYLVKYLLLIGKYLIYWGAMALTTLYIILALCRRTAGSNDKMFTLDLALSKSVYSDSSTNRLVFGV